MLKERSKSLSTFPSAKPFNHASAACGLLMYATYVDNTCWKHTRLTSSVISVDLATTESMYKPWLT